MQTNQIINRLLVGKDTSNTASIETQIKMVKINCLMNSFQLEKGQLELVQEGMRELLIPTKLNPLAKVYMTEVTEDNPLKSTSYVSEALAGWDIDEHMLGDAQEVYRVSNKAYHLIYQEDGEHLGYYRNAHGLLQNGILTLVTANSTPKEDLPIMLKEFRQLLAFRRRKVTPLQATMATIIHAQ